MAIAHIATEYVFSDFLLKEPPETRYKGLRLDLALDKIVTCIAVGLPLLLISLAFAQEVSIGAQISCFAPSSFSWRQAAYVDSYCWAAVQQKQASHNNLENIPLWLHKENVSELKSFKCLKVLENIAVSEKFDVMQLLVNLGTIKTDTIDGKPGTAELEKPEETTTEELEKDATELQVLADRDASGSVNTREDKRLRQRLIDSSC
ncbi:pannexin-1 isoform X2 [Onychostruthus taczanowskii]|uniref:pannexin-1 isoform X2 n=1 Tax=Onychostruthus taczanowskii TaxID=356909 RepID=UPI001B80ACB6|nr:pannexin-1 isoform X2 [Onychostruthus taczanowskii]